MHRLWFQLEPRDERTAARTAAWIYLVSSVVAGGSTVLIPPQGAHGTERALLVCALLLVLGALLAWPMFHHKRLVLLLTPLIGVGVVLYLNLATHDASAAAQVTFCLPVLFGASQLRLLGSGLATLTAIAADIVDVLRFRPNTAGILDVVDVSLVLLLMTGLLVGAGRRQDRLVARLEDQAGRDPLTGLVTRRVLDRAAEQALGTPPPHPGTALVLVDVDHFKSINDNYGHPVGDDALVHVGRTLRRQAPPEAVVSRLGGDEIAVLLPGCTEAVARDRAQTFLTALRENALLLPDGSLLPISISIGVGHAPNGDAALRDLYALADASLYQAKRAGRGRLGSPAAGPAVFEAPVAVAPVARGAVPEARSYRPYQSLPPADRADGSERLADRPLEVGHVPGGVLEGDLGPAGDDRLDHR